MPLKQTTYYQTHLATLHQQVCGHNISQAYLTGTGIRYDGEELKPTDSFEFPFGQLSTLEFAHLFSIFDGSRVHQQAEKHPGLDDAPPGMYFTVINNKVIQSPHKNKIGIFTEEDGITDLFIESLHIDHYFLNERMTPPMLGTFAFALCAITSHLAGLGNISLIAAGGKGFNHNHVGYKVWPKLGFDAQLLPGETGDVLHLQGCCTVQNIQEVDPAWWDAHGSQRRMTFDLSADSVSWRKLISYTQEKLLGGSRG